MYGFEMGKEINLTLHILSFKEDFGVFVQRHNAVYHQQGSECDATGKCVEEKVTSEVLQRFEELTTFFPLKRPCS